MSGLYSRSTSEESTESVQERKFAEGGQEVAGNSCESSTREPPKDEPALARVRTQSLTRKKVDLHNVQRPSGKYKSLNG